MKKYILLLCILGNPYDLIHGGHQRTIMEIIQHFKYHSDLNFSIITSKISDTQGYCKFRFIGSPIPLATDQCFRNR